MGHYDMHAYGICTATTSFRTDSHAGKRIPLGWGSRVHRHNVIVSSHACRRGVARFGGEGRAGWQPPPPSPPPSSFSPCLPRKSVAIFSLHSLDIWCSAARPMGCSAENPAARCCHIADAYPTWHCRYGVFAAGMVSLVPAPHLLGPLRLRLGGCVTTLLCYFCFSLLTPAHLCSADSEPGRRNS